MSTIEVKKGIKVVPFQKKETRATAKDVIDQVLKDGLDNVKQIIVITMGEAEGDAYHNGLLNSELVLMLESYKYMLLKGVHG